MTETLQARELEVDTGTSTRHYFDLLPSELWCKIWEHLPFADRIFVTHVCRKWRTVALDWPSLWSHITFYTSVTGSSEGSDSDDEDSDIWAPPLWMDSPYPSNATNIDAAPILLARGAAVSLHITLDIVTFFIDTKVLDVLSTALTRNAVRIVSLHIRSRNSHPVSSFLESLGSLPALLFLIAETLPHSQGYSAASPLVPKNWASAAPRLTGVHMTGGYLWPSHDRLEPFTSIRSMHIAPSRDLETELIAALTGCPNLRELHLDLSSLRPRWPWDRHNGRPHALCLLAEGIPSVTVSDMSPAYEGWVLQVFSSDTRPTLASVYSVNENAEQGGIELLRNLEGQLHVTLIHQRLSFDGQLISVDVADLSGRRRRITQNSVSEWYLDGYLFLAVLRISDIWECVTKLTVDATFWSARPDALPANSSVANLELIEDGTGLLATMSTELVMGLNYPRCTMPVQTLTLARGPAGERMSAEEIALLVHHVMLRTCQEGPSWLKKLRVDSRLIAGAQDGLHELAESVVIGPV